MTLLQKQNLGLKGQTISVIIHRTRAVIFYVLLYLPTHLMKYNIFSEVCLSTLFFICLFIYLLFCFPVSSVKWPHVHRCRCFCASVCGCLRTAARRRLRSHSSVTTSRIGLTLRAAIPCRHTGTIFLASSPPPSLFTFISIPPPLRLPPPPSAVVAPPPPPLLALLLQLTTSREPRLRHNKSALWFSPCRPGDARLARLQCDVINGPRRMWSPARRSRRMAKPGLSAAALPLLLLGSFLSASSVKAGELDHRLVSDHRR